jgi:DNA-binding response OmpR family regulator
MPSRVLVVDDERNIVQLVRLYLSKEGFDVDSAFDGKQALDKVHSHRPDLIVLDLMMPEMDGLTVCRELRKTSNVPIIILTARSDDVDKVVGLELGADDYVTKPFSPGLDEPAAVLEAGDLRLDVPRREATLKGEPLSLRAKEFDLLAAFLQNEGLVMDRERLIQRVWGHDFYGDSRTIDVHVAWLREKLAGSSVQIQTVWGIGYKLVVNPDADKPQK